MDSSWRVVAVIRREEVAASEMEVLPRERSVT